MGTGPDPPPCGGRRWGRRQNRNTTRVWKAPGFPHDRVLVQPTTKRWPSVGSAVNKLFPRCNSFIEMGKDAIASVPVSPLRTAANIFTEEGNDSRWFSTQSQRLHHPRLSHLHILQFRCGLCDALREAFRLLIRGTRCAEQLAAPLL